MPFRYNMIFNLRVMEKITEKQTKSNLGDRIKL